MNPIVSFFNTWTNHPTVFQAGEMETEASWVKEIELKRASPPGGTTPVRITGSNNPYMVTQIRDSLYCHW